MKAQLPRYIDRAAMNVYPQPVNAPGMEMYAFLLEGDPAALGDLCDQVLNAVLGSSEARFKPLSGWLLLSVARLPRLTSGVPRYQGQLWLQEREVAFWMLVGREGGPPMWFNPYIFVDHPWALSAGREIFGYPKEFAWLQMPDTPSSADSFTLDAVAVKRFGSSDPAEQEARRRRLLELRRVDGKFHEIEHSLETLLVELGRLLTSPGSGILSSLKTVWELFKEIRDNRVATVFLKQFRDVSEGARAAYQQLVWAPASGKLNGLGLLGLYHLTLQSLESHLIARDLGLKTTAQGCEAPGFWINMDFVLGDGGPLSSERQA